jgi:branched-chain amino acid transport system ATP-binding protein
MLMTMLLEIKDLNAGYGPITALFGINLKLNEGDTLALIGANGAGKTTLLRIVTGLIVPNDGVIQYKGKDIGGFASHRIASMGISMVPEGRRLFPSLTVEENLIMGACTNRKGEWTLEKVYKLFPILKDFRKRMANMLSGGQQQMVAVGRALMANPLLLLCDELSLGLAPVIVKDIYKTLETVTKSGVSLIIVEQDINQAIASSDNFLCMREGEIVLSGTKESADRAEIAQAYFGN